MTASKARRLRRSQATAPKGERPALARLEAPKGVVDARPELTERSNERLEAVTRNVTVGSMSSTSAGDSRHNKSSQTQPKGNENRDLAESGNVGYPPSDDDGNGVALLPLLIGAAGTIMLATPIPLAIGAALALIGTSQDDSK